MERVTARFKNILKQFLKHKISKISLLLFGKPRYEIVSKKVWEEEYSNGRWKKLERLDELSRYSVIVGYVDYYINSGYLKHQKILDVGCGHGLLQKILKKRGYALYRGIDISSEAIAQASQKKDDITSFMQSDLQDFDTLEKYDCIIFNEVLSYLKSPLLILNKYKKYLEKDGIIIISQYRDKSLSNEYSWSLIDKAWPPDDEVKLLHFTGLSWVVKSYKIVKP